MCVAVTFFFLFRLDDKRTNPKHKTFIITFHIIINSRYSVVVIYVHMVQIERKERERRERMRMTMTRVNEYI